MHDYIGFLRFGGQVGYSSFSREGSVGVDFINIVVFYVFEHFWPFLDVFKLSSGFLGVWTDLGGLGLGYFRD